MSSFLYIIKSMQLVVNGVLTNYLDINSKQKQTLVILHGWASSLSFWLPMAQLLSPRWRIVLLDLPGFGFTPPIDDTPDIPEYTHFVRSFAKRLKLRKFILVGHSFGGQIALDYALKFPTDLINLILVAPAAIREKSKILKFKIRLASAIRPFLSKSSYRYLEQFLGWYTPIDYSNSNEYQRKVLRKIAGYNLKPLLHLLSVPTDIIWGSLDLVIPNAGKYLLKKISRSRLHIIPGASHLVNLTHTEKLAKIINSILLP